MIPPFEITKTAIAGLLVLKRKPLADHRGMLERLFDSEELRAITGNAPIEQINRSRTAKRGMVRGMHFQHPPHAEVKLVTCLRGEAFDVAVDLRRDSPTFLRWHAELLTESSDTTFVIPRGFAHGFQALTDSVELLYFHNPRFSADSQGAVNVRDPRLGIQWPEPIIGLSDRDESLPMLNDSYRGIAL